MTGSPAVNSDFQTTSEEDLKRAEVLTFALVLILLLVTFRTVVSAVVPLILGAAAVVTATAAIYVDRLADATPRSSPSTLLR